MPRKPRLDALVMADLVYPGPGGKYIILGTFNTWKVQQVPQQVFSPWGTAGVVYANVTELQGAFRLVLRVRHLASDTLIAESPVLEGECSDPLASLEFVMGLPPLDVPAEGSYSLELVINDETIGTKRMAVELVQEDEAEA